LSALERRDPSKGAAAGRQAQQNKADAFAVKMMPIIDAIRARGVATLQGIAEELVRMNWKTARGGDEWTATAVRNLLMRRKEVAQ